MKHRLDVLYRGPLRSCNFQCEYCPFGREPVTTTNTSRDRAALCRLIRWVEITTDRKLGVFFTPSGEALVHQRYRNAVIRLSHLPQVRRVAIQTNGSADLGWLGETRTDRIGIWLSWHPGAMPMELLLQRCDRMVSLGVSHSVGVVGCREHLGLIERLRKRLPDTTYLWVNALRRLDPPYDENELAAIERIDPLFRFNLKLQQSRGRRCDAGRSVIAIDGEGDIRPCHFQSEIIGSIDDPAWASALQPRRCPSATCHCHIGYVHMPELGLESVFGPGMLERVPKREWKGWGTWLS